MSSYASFSFGEEQPIIQKKDRSSYESKLSI